MMPADTGNNSGEGFRITIGVLYTMLQDQGRMLDTQSRQIAVMDQRLTTVLNENTEDKKRINKLETRMNGVFTGIGVGIITALIAIFRGVIT